MGKSCMISSVWNMAESRGFAFRAWGFRHLHIMSYMIYSGRGYSPDYQPDMAT